jgi:hypothetical protein
MTRAVTLPGESNGHIISSIINLVLSTMRGEECRNSNVKGDAAEVGLQNGTGRIR